jgi:hypothetical protein
VFFVNVPLAGIVAVAALFVIPDDRRGAVRERRRFDLPGALTVTGGATLLVFGLVQGPEVGWTDPAIIGAFAPPPCCWPRSRWWRRAARTR